MRCFYHPDAGAVGICQECGKSACRQCIDDFKGTMLCKGCLDRLRAAREAQASKSHANVYQISELTASRHESIV